MKLSYQVFFMLALLFKTSFIYPQTANSLYESGISKFRQNDLAGAIAEFTKCIVKNEIFYDAYIGRGECYAAQKKYNEALKDFSKALEIYPNYYPAFLKRADTYVLAGDNKKALADYAKAIELKKDKEDAYLCRAKLYQKNDDLKLALIDLTTALEINSKNPDVFFQRGLIYELQKKDKEAIGDFKKTILLDPAFAEAYYRRGLLYEKLSNYQAAAQDYKKASDLNIRNKELFIHKAQATFYSGLWDEAIKDYSELFDTYAVKDPGSYYNRGICYYKSGKLIEALKDFSKTAQLNTQNDSAYVWIAQIYTEQKNMKSAQVYYNKAISVNPGNYKAYAGRAKIFSDQKKFEQAIQDWNIALKSVPDPEWFFERALCKEAIKDKKGWCDDLKSASDLGLKKATQLYDSYCK